MILNKPRQHIVFTDEPQCGQVFHVIQDALGPSIDDRLFTVPSFLEPILELPQYASARGPEIHDAGLKDQGFI